ncbi:hypothetical protein F8M41_016680 [Gigaspora margarita]|uniref:Uncharacterized protein n=1 Tax=Gigaspora margarita TaxID=4874 RepID=A0A8H4EMR4_GIGMA|nr:hypothetical protein F8M41_016680 [Gigaspora margarita]
MGDVNGMSSVAECYRCGIGGSNEVEGGKDFVNKTFSEVLKNLKVIDSNYATEPIETSFNWNEIASDIKDIEGEWYLVAFRSIRSINANNDSLSNAEKKAYNEAEKHGGLLKYWSGEFNQNRKCLSICIWASKDIAVEASKEPQHSAAKKLANMSNYEFYGLERYMLTKKKNETEIKIIQISDDASI